MIEPTSTPTDLFGPLLTTIRDYAAAYCVPGPRARSIIAVGEVAFDDCCNGQVWARLISAQPSDTNQRGFAQQSGCGVLMWDATIGVGAIRCAPTIDDQSNPPSEAALCASTNEVTGDMAALLTAIQCDVAMALGPRRVRIVRWDSITPEGGCVGGEWIISVLVDNCGCGG